MESRSLKTQITQRKQSSQVKSIYSQTKVQLTSDKTKIDKSSRNSKYDNNDSKLLKTAQENLQDQKYFEQDQESKDENGLSDNNDESFSDQSDDFKDSLIHKKDLIYNPESQLRKWLKSRGKEHCIDFEDEELRQLRNYFNSLDDDGSGSIGVDELEDPLIALGLVENRQQVQKIVQMVDDDGSSMIEFPEFLSIIKGGSNQKERGAKDDGTGAIYQFFKDLTSRNMQIAGNENIPFSLFISTQRRKKILASMMSKDPHEKKEGEKILANYKKQLAEKLAREHMEKIAINIRPQSSSQISRKSKVSSALSSIKSKQQKGLDESEQQKIIQQKYHDVSTFKGEPPEPEQINEILKRKSKIL